MEAKIRKNPRKQLQGYASKKKGQEFEAIIEAACRQYRVNRIAYIEKTPEPMRPIGGSKNGTFPAIFAKKAQPDFKGTLRGGRSICFEAKSREGDRVNRTALSKEQMESLQDHTELGAETFVLLCMNRMDYYRVPWVKWKNMKTFYNRMYMTIEELEPNRIEFDLTLQFLKGVQYET